MERQYWNQLTELKNKAVDIIESFAKSVEYKHEKIYSNGGKEWVYRDFSGHTFMGDVLFYKKGNKYYKSVHDGMCLIDGLDIEHICNLADYCLKHPDYKG